MLVQAEDGWHVAKIFKNLTMDELWVYLKTYVPKLGRPLILYGKL